MIGSAELIFLFDFHSYLVFNPSPRCCGTSGSVLVAPQLQGAATEGIGDSFVPLSRVLWCWCWVSFARAFLLGRLVIISSLIILLERARHASRALRRAPTGKGRF